MIYKTPFDYVIPLGTHNVTINGKITSYALYALNEEKDRVSFGARYGNEPWEYLSGEARKQENGEWSIFAHDVVALAASRYFANHRIEIENESLSTQLEDCKEQLQDACDYGPLYCPTCGSCGEEGCCDPAKCKAVQCLYPDRNIESYRELEAQLEACQRENERMRGQEHHYQSHINRLKKLHNPKFMHACPDWDFLEIDEYDLEINGCTCDLQALGDSHE